jgi:hypothetical protein
MASVSFRHFTRVDGGRRDDRGKSNISSRVVTAPTQAELDDAFGILPYLPESAGAGGIDGPTNSIKYSSGRYHIVKGPSKRERNSGRSSRSICGDNDA